MTEGAARPLADRVLPQRTLEERITQAPVSFKLGGETHELRVLRIGEVRSWKAYASGKLAEIMGTDTTGDKLLELAMRIMRQGVDEQLDLILRYDVDETIAGRYVDEERGLIGSTWVEEHATELEVEHAFLGVLSVGFPFARRVRALVEGQDWGGLLKTIGELTSKPTRSTPTTPSSPTRTS